VGSRKGAAALALAACVAASVAAHAAEVEVSERHEGGPRISVTLSATSALSLLVDAERTAGWSFGGAAGISKAGPGIGGFLQVGYWGPSDHWDHAVPIDVGGQYRWGDLRRSIVLSGGMSFIAFAPREGMAPRRTIGISDGWQIAPLVFVGVGGRLMFLPHLGLDLQVEARSYWAINVVAARLSLVF
jgi:hypothetical protein